MRRILRVFLALGVVLAVTGLARAQDDARAILEKAIKARGGEENLAKLKAMRTKVKGTMELPMGTVQFTGEAVYQLPDRQRTSLEVQAQGMTIAVIGVYDGTNGWRGRVGDPMELTGPDLASLKGSLHAQYVSTLLPLRDKQYELAKLDEIMVNGKPAVGLKITAKDRPEVKLYFEKESGLLVKGERMTFDRQAGKEVLSESFVSEWKEFKGIKFPVKSHIHRGGKKVEEVQTLEVEVLDQVDAKLFAKP